MVGRAGSQAKGPRGGVRAGPGGAPGAAVVCPLGPPPMRGCMCWPPGPLRIPSLHIIHTVAMAPRNARRPATSASMCKSWTARFSRMVAIGCHPRRPSRSPPRTIAWTRTSGVCREPVAGQHGKQQAEGRKGVGLGQSSQGAVAARSDSPQQDHQPDAPTTDAPATQPGNEGKLLGCLAPTCQDKMPPTNSTLPAGAPWCLASARCWCRRSRA